uniref:Peptidase C19 ubiquitin carboxyl-terminal hydrolase domain-containing protein n=1 Tax=Timema monikensis TaxID=170555 RepID=A0A7R9EJL5_9NEOP|nr:unnamed protein product [Timema monikensis]
MEKELRLGSIASLQHSLPVFPQHSLPIIPQHSSPVIPQLSLPIIPQHSSSVIPQHSSPVIPQHSSPVIPQLSLPIIPQHSSPVIPHHSPKPIHLKTLPNEKNPIRNVKYVGNFRSEPLTSISSHKPPYEIGFVNPVGSNRCWLNASLQAILGMQLLIEDIVQYEKPSPSRVLAAFRELVLTRKTGSQLSTHSALQKLYQSLEDIDPVFVNGNQQDAPEFVNRLLDTFRNLFSQMLPVSPSYTASTQPSHNWQQLTEREPRYHDGALRKLIDVGYNNPWQLLNLLQEKSRSKFLSEQVHQYSYVGRREFFIGGPAVMRQASTHTGGPK